LRKGLFRFLEYVAHAGNVLVAFGIRAECLRTSNKALFCAKVLHQRTLAQAKAQKTQWMMLSQKTDESAQKQKSLENTRNAFVKVLHGV
jgi:hypothetical protein